MIRDLPQISINTPDKVLITNRINLIITGGNMNTVVKILILNVTHTALDIGVIMTDLRLNTIEMSLIILNLINLNKITTISPIHDTRIVDHNLGVTKMMASIERLTMMIGIQSPITSVGHIVADMMTLRMMRITDIPVRQTLCMVLRTDTDLRTDTVLITGMVLITQVSRTTGTIMITTTALITNMGPITETTLTTVKGLTIVVNLITGEILITIRGDTMTTVGILISVIALMISKNQIIDMDLIIGEGLIIDLKEMWTTSMVLIIDVHQGQTIGVSLTLDIGMIMGHLICPTKNITDDNQMLRPPTKLASQKLIRTQLVDVPAITAAMRGHNLYRDYKPLKKISEY
jgi:hypothetical protein